MKSSDLPILTQLKRAKAKEKDRVSFYKSIVRPQLEYACQAWSTNITQNQSDTIERIQKRAMRIIYPNEEYSDAIEKEGTETLSQIRSKLCKKLFTQIQHPTHVLNHLLPKENENTSTRRHTTRYTLPQVNSNRYKNSFIMHSLFNFQ